MRSKGIQVAHDLAEHIDRAISAKGLPPLIKDGLSRFNFSVRVVHEEGTVFVYQNAYCLKWHCWLMVFPEHHDINVFHVEELASWGMYKWVKTPEIIVPSYQPENPERPLVSFTMGEGCSFEVQLRPEQPDDEEE